MLILVRRVARTAAAFVVAAGLSGVAACFIVLKYHGTLRLLRQMSPTPRTDRPNVWVHRFAALVQGSEAWPTTRRFRCIHRAALIWWGARWLGLRSVIQSGAVEEPAGALLIHAWVECEDGGVLGDSPEHVARFTRLWPQLGAASVMLTRLPTSATK